MTSNEIALYGNIIAKQGDSDLPSNSDFGESNYRTSIIFADRDSDPARISYR